MTLISKKRAEEIREAAAKQGSNKLPKGEAVLRLLSVEGKNSSKGNPMLVVTFTDQAGNYDPVTEYFVFTPGTEVSNGERKLGKLFDSLGVELQEAKDLTDLARQLTRAAQGRRVKACIIHEAQLYKPADGRDWIIMEKPRVNYTGHIDKELMIDPARLMKPLNDVEQAEWDAYQKAKSGVGVTAAHPPATTPGDPFALPTEAPNPFA